MADPGTVQRILMETCEKSGFKCVIMVFTFHTRQRQENEADVSFENQTRG